MVALQKRGLIGILAVLLMLPSVFADPVYYPQQKQFDVHVLPVITDVEVGRWGEYNITVVNNNHLPDRFFFSINEEGVEFNSLTEPTRDYSSGLVVRGFSDASTLYKLKASSSVLPNVKKPYMIELGIRSQATDAVETVSLPMRLLPEGYNEKLAIDVTVDVSVPQYIDPRNVYSFKISLTNNNDANLGLVDISLFSKLLDKRTKIEIGPKAQKTVDFPVSFPQDQQPAQDVLTVAVQVGNTTLYKTEIPFEIVAYRISFSQDVQEKKEFLKRTTIITVTNKENVAEQQVVKAATSLTDRLLSTTSPKASVMREKGTDYFIWDVQLNPGQSATVTIVANYRIITGILVIVGILLLIVYISKDSITITKQSEIIKTFEEGIVELKVVLNIKNRTNRQIKHVEVLDKVPSIASVKKGEVHTLHPSKYMQAKDGTILKWDIGVMDPQEERLLMYVMKSKLSILGDFRMPSAIVKYKEGDGTPASVRSNEMDVSSRKFVQATKKEE